MNKFLLIKISLINLIVWNAGIILIFMTVNSYICDDGLSGGECVKRLDNIMFLLLSVLNLLLAVYCLVKVDRSKWWMFILAYICNAFFYIIAAFFHSISKTGLF